MGVYIPNMEKPKSCGECRFESTQYINNYCRRTFCNLGADYEHCPLIEIDDETDEEWYDWRDEQEYEDRWERRADVSESDMR